MAAGLIDAMAEWVRKQTASGKIEQVWGFAGLQAGTGIANVNSLEELDALMIEFPFAPFSDIEIYGLVDIGKSLQTMKQAVQAMTPPK
jgi:muconolactone delta-isomerase